MYVSLVTFILFNISQYITIYDIAQDETDLHDSDSNSGISTYNLENVSGSCMCIVCNKFYKRLTRVKRYEKLSHTNSYETFDAVKEYATKTNDINLLVKLKECQDNDLEIVYHKHCKTNYCTACSTKKKKKTDWHEKRNRFERAFKRLRFFIEEHVIIGKTACSMTFVVDVFLELLSSEYEMAVDKELFYVKHIPGRIEKCFNKKIKITRISGEKFLAPVNTNIIINSEELKKKDLILQAALHLRCLLQQIEPQFLGNKITACDLIRGECVLPKELVGFYTTLLAGYNYRKRKNEKTTRLANSFSADVVYALSNGKIKPSKSITLGSAMKSLTSSKKVVKILHSYGHICSYDTLQGLETEATYTTIESKSHCPSDIMKKQGLRTSVAFDNFDRFIETTSGKVTLNDTVGIIIQDLEPVEQTSESMEIEENDANDVTDDGKRRRSYTARGGIVGQSYAKRAKMCETLQPSGFHLRNAVPEDLQIMKELDVAWVLSHVCQIRTPMWVGYNSKIIPNDQKKQIISYLTPINQSPTDPAVVLETMCRAQAIAEECHEQYAQVTYDLGIANIAYKIQSEEKRNVNLSGRNDLKNVFIHLGIFHIIMSYFKAIGSFLNGCGLTTIMVEAGLIGSGSVSTFLNGKHFNRCKRLHIMMSLALQMQEFEYFIQKESVDLNVDVRKYLTDLQTTPLDSLAIENENVRDVLRRFLSFHDEIVQGSHGKTMQFYAIYIQLIGYYYLLERSSRMRNVRMLCYVLEKINNIFFAFNHMNYARWLTWYHDALMNVDENYPGLSKDLLFSVKRTEKSFSCIPIDLTLEQTINADAARRLTGIMNLTNSISARIRWSLNHGLRSSIISHVLEESGLKKVQDASNDLLPHRITKSKQQVDTFIGALNERMNPFKPHDRFDVLFNISTGQATSSEVTNFLISIESIGETSRTKFIDSCVNDPTKFQQAIKRNKILNFDSCTKKRKIKIGGKIQEVKLQRDLFGRLIGISLERKIDLAKILSFPLTPVPLSLCHLDGTIVSTEKSVLTRILEKTIKDPAEPGCVDILLIDGFFLMHTLKNLPQKFGDVALEILKSVTTDGAGKPNTAKQIYVLFDTYKSPSIKDYEHEMRESYNKEYSITGPQQNRPSDFGNELKNVHFKKAFVEFLTEHWGSERSAQSLFDKEVFVSFEKCYKYHKVGNTVSMSLKNELKCEGHEEADTKFAFFISKLSGPKNVVIKCSDTDILIIILGNMSNFDQSLQIFIKFGTGSNVRFIDTTKISKELGPEVCGALPAFHAFTGCDYNPSFYRKAKTKPFKLLLTSVEYQDAFLNIHDCQYHSTIERFVCDLYATQKNKLRNEVSVNAARVQLFNMNYSVVDDLENFKKEVVNFDACMLPPTQRELEQHILRTKYIASVWCNATLPIPSSLDPLLHGWELSDNGKLTFHWFDGDEMPEFVEEVLLQPETDTESNIDEPEENVISDESESDNDSDSESIESDDSFESSRESESEQ